MQGEVTEVTPSGATLKFHDNETSFEGKLDFATKTIKVSACDTVINHHDVNVVCLHRDTTIKPEASHWLLWVTKWGPLM